MPSWLLPQLRCAHNNHTIATVTSPTKRYNISSLLQEDLKVTIAEVTKKCADEFKISAEQLAALHDKEQKAKLNITDDIKCFSKCAFINSKFVKDDELDVERLVSVAKAHGKEADKVRANVPKCQEKVKAAKDCASYWDVYACFQQ